MKSAQRGLLERRVRDGALERDGREHGADDRNVDARRVAPRGAVDGRRAALGSSASCGRARRSCRRPGGGGGASPARDRRRRGRRGRRSRRAPGRLVRAAARRVLPRRLRPGVGQFYRFAAVEVCAPCPGVAVSLVIGGSAAFAGPAASRRALGRRRVALGAAPSSSSPRSTRPTRARLPVRFPPGRRRRRRARARRSRCRARRHRSRSPRRPRTTMLMLMARSLAVVERASRSSAAASHPTSSRCSRRVVVGRSLRARPRCSSARGGVRREAAVAFAAPPTRLAFAAGMGCAARVEPVSSSATICSRALADDPCRREPSSSSPPASLVRVGPGRTAGGRSSSSARARPASRSARRARGLAACAARRPTAAQSGAGAVHVAINADATPDRADRRRRRGPRDYGSSPARERGSGPQSTVGRVCWIPQYHLRWAVQISPSSPDTKIAES